MTQTQAAKHWDGPLEIRAPIQPVPHDKQENRLLCGRDGNGNLLHIAETYQYQNHQHNTQDGTSLANADRIFLCCNLHDELVTVCTRLAEAVEVIGRHHNEGEEITTAEWDELRDARGAARDGLCAIAKATPTEASQ